MKSLDFFPWKKTVQDEASSTSAYFFEMGGEYLPAILMVQWNMGSWKMTSSLQMGYFPLPWEEGYQLFPRRNFDAGGIRVFLSVLEIISLGGGFYKDMFGIFARETWKKTDHFEFWL